MFDRVAGCEYIFIWRTSEACPLKNSRGDNRDTIRANLSSCLSVVKWAWPQMLTEGRWSSSADLTKSGEYCLRHI